MADHLAAVSRRLRARCDAIIAGIWTVPDLPGLAARIAPAGDLASGAAAALLAPINPAAVAAQVASARATETAAELVARRLVTAERELVAVIGDEPEHIGRALDLLWPAAQAARVAGRGRGRARHPGGVDRRRAERRRRRAAHAPRAVGPRRDGRDGRPAASRALTAPTRGYPRRPRPPRIRRASPVGTRCSASS